MSIQDSAASVEFSELDGFLGPINQGHLTKIFVDNEITTLKDIKRLTDANL